MANGDSAHLHAATAIGTANWTASYDAAGDMTCRAPTSAATCAGTTPTGAQLSYDNEGRLSAWQNAPSSPTSTDQFLYDGAGQRVEQQATSSGATTTTVYVGQVEELSTTGSTTTTTTYYYAGGKRIALAVNGSFYYLGSDGLGSASVALDRQHGQRADERAVWAVWHGALHERDNAGELWLHGAACRRDDGAGLLQRAVL